MKIGILQTGHLPDTLVDDFGEYDVLFRQLLGGQGFAFKTYDVVDMVFPKTARDCDGWLITGSKHGAYEDHGFIPVLEHLVRAIYAAQLPLVGICFGHQIIAQALGGKVEKFDGGWAVGRQSYDWAGAEVNLNAWHQDQVTQIPDSATPIARNMFCENAALVYGDRIFTVQAHPEFENDFVGKLAAVRGPGVVPEALLDAVQGGLAQPVDNAYLAKQITRFFKERRLS